MNGPSYKLRLYIAEWAHSLREMSDEEAESGVDSLLSMILKELESEIAENLLRRQESDFEDIVSVCHSWASLASHAVAEVYAPNSPFPRNVAGWGNRAISRLNYISAALRKPLYISQKLLGADSYSISVGFPWGISIGFSWS